MNTDLSYNDMSLDYADHLSENVLQFALGEYTAVTGIRVSQDGVLLNFQPDYIVNEDAVDGDNAIVDYTLQSWSTYRQISRDMEHLGYTLRGAEADEEGEVLIFRRTQ